MQERTLLRGSSEMAIMTRVPISVQRHRPAAVLNSSPILKSECFMTFKYINSKRVLQLYAATTWPGEQYTWHFLYMLAIYKND